MTVRVFTPAGDIFTIDAGEDWMIDPDGTLTVVDAGLEPLGIFNPRHWVHAQRGKLAEAK